MWCDKRSILAPLAIFIGMMTVPCAAGVRLSLHQKATARGVHILLSEVADIEGTSAEEKRALESFLLGYSPTGDYERVLNRKQIEKALGRQGVDPVELTFQGAEQVRITAHRRSLDTQQISEAIRSTLETAFPPGLIHIQSLTVRLPGRVMVPPSGVLIVPDMERWGGGSRQEVQVQLYQGGQRLRRLFVGVHLRWAARVPFATHYLKSGHVLRKADYRWVQQLREDNPLHSILDPRVLTGMTLRHGIQTGGLLHRSVLRHQRLVERGSVVELNIKGKGFQLRMTGLAQQHGGLGEKIRVFNPKTKRVLVGRISGRNRVEIHL